MYLQFIHGTTSDRARLRTLLDRWTTDLRPGAIGYVGSTVGITADGDVLALARFESADAAAKNGSRPEQDAWWREMTECLEGEPVVKNTENVDVMFDDGCDRAQFVQVMEGSGDEAKLRELDRQFTARAKDLRPDLLGGYRAYFDDGTFADVGYFTTEAEARAGERREVPPDVAELFAELGRLVPNMTYYDLTEPLLD